MRDRRVLGSGGNETAAIRVESSTDCECATGRDGVHGALLERAWADNSSIGSVRDGRKAPIEATMCTHLELRAAVAAQWGCSSQNEGGRRLRRFETRPDTIPSRGSDAVRRASPTFRPPGLRRCKGRRAAVGSYCIAEDGVRIPSTAPSAHAWNPASKRRPSPPEPGGSKSSCRACSGLRGPCGSKQTRARISAAPPPRPDDRPEGPPATWASAEPARQSRNQCALRVRRALLSEKNSR
jgi:hypothetical protein